MDFTVLTDDAIARVCFSGFWSFVFSGDGVGDRVARTSDAKLPTRLQPPSYRDLRPEPEEIPLHRSAFVAALSTLPAAYEASDIPRTIASS